MNLKNMHRVKVGRLGVILGILVVVISIVFVAILNIGRDEYSGNEITWVG